MRRQLNETCSAPTAFVYQRCSPYSGHSAMKSVASSRRATEYAAMAPSSSSVARALWPVLGSGVRHSVALRAAVPVEAQRRRIIAEFADRVEHGVRQGLDRLARMKVGAG